MNEKGVFITFEGCEGVGKSTHAKRLAAMLADRGAVFTREPGGTPVAEKIREILISDTLTVSPEIEAELFAVQRREHADNLILPALRSGRQIYRFVHSLSRLCARNRHRQGVGTKRIHRQKLYAGRHFVFRHGTVGKFPPQERFCRRTRPFRRGEAGIPYGLCRGI